MNLIPKEEELNTLFYWMQERHRIHHRKLSSCSKPWTEDPVLQDYRFCNVFRELDTTTIWMKENIRDKYADHPYLWFAFAVARRINLIDTLEDLGKLLVEWDSGFAEDVLNSRKEAGLQIYNGAYMLTTGGQAVPKNHHTCVNIGDPLWNRREHISEILESQQLSLEGVFNLFATGNPGISGFIAYEMVTDMRHTRYLKDAPDIYTWANAGPGAMRGLNRIFERPIDKKLKPCQSNTEMLYLLQEAELYLPESFPKLEMRDIEHSLCEFDKYQRVKTEKGFLRQKYNGRGE